ncbi:hypothetical protein CR513_19885, partial [Mucuna pruriens]
MLDREFLVDLICLPLNQLDVILDKFIVFGSPDVGKDESFMSTNQVKAYLKENARAYMLLSSLKVENKVIIGDVSFVRDFPKVFP